jgi:hypothetical protein
MESRLQACVPEGIESARYRLPDRVAAVVHLRRSPWGNSTFRVAVSEGQRARGRIGVYRADRQPRVRCVVRSKDSPAGSMECGQGQAKFRIDGIAKVTGAKVFARDVRAADMPHWPKQQAHAFILRTTLADRLYEGFVLAVVSVLNGYPTRGRRAMNEWSMSGRHLGKGRPFVLQGTRTSLACVQRTVDRHTR